MSEAERLNLDLDLEDGYRFVADFGDGMPPLRFDEPAPLGEGSGPNAARVLAAAIGDCLSASALYCLRRAHVDVHAMHTSVEASLERNERGRLRVTGVQVRVEPVVDQDDQPRMRRCMELFEDFCVVTQSVRAGIDVKANVEPRAPAEAA